MVSNTLNNNSMWSLLETMNKQYKSFLTMCPTCGKLGRLYFNKSIGWYIKHGGHQTHYVKDGEALEIPLHNPRLTLFHYMGGDYYLLPYISKMIPPHICYVEVFGGAASLLLNKPPSKVEVYNDIDGNLVNLFKVVRDKPDELVREFDTWVVYSRQMHYEMLKMLEKEKDDVRRATMFLALIYMSFNGNLNAGFSTSKVNNQAKKMFNVIDRIKDIHKRLKNVVIEQLDFREIIKRYDSAKTFFYLDPPHLYYATEKARKEGDYYIKTLNEKDYMDLLNILEKTEGKWLLKQNYIPFILEWAKKNNYSTTMIQLSKPSTLSSNENRETMKVVFVANFQIKNRSS